MTTGLSAGLSVVAADRPSIFELVASQALDSTFHPALHRVATYLASKNPEKLGSLLAYYDEVFLVLSGVVHSHYLRRNGGSLSEVFYGLTRFNLRTDQFTTRDYVVSMVFLVGLPYLTRKLEQRMKQLKEKLEDELTTDDKMQLLQLYAFRTVKVSLALAQIIRYVSYLSGRSSSHSLQLMVSRIGLRHSQPQVNAFSWSDLMHGKVRISTLFSTVVLRSLEFGGFFLQFLQWFNESSTTPPTISKMSIPEPPPADVNAHRYCNTCPICLQEFQIPTILRISGYVFCYKCITNHLKKHKFCPVTTYPATMDDLVRMFDN